MAVGGGKKRAKRGDGRRKTAKGRRKTPNKNSTSHGALGARLWAWTKRQAMRAAVVSVLIGAGIGYWFYDQARAQVEAVLARPLWAEQGQITGTVTVMAGLEVGPEDVASVLARAGYSRVNAVEEEGDFAIKDPLILVRDQGIDVLMTFAESRIVSVSPNAVHRFRATELAGLGGADERRQPISLAQMPSHLVSAVLAMEDARFFEHHGVDGFGILRALVANVLTDGHKQGGSTLTQQLAKNLFLTPERTLKRKLKELTLAVALEQRLSKEEILELYLNQVYLGAVGGVGVCGVAQAAATYFGTSAKRLSLAQAATLAGIISAPNRYSPRRHPGRAATRRDRVLGRMVELGWIDAAERRLAEGEGLKVVPSIDRRLAPWALDEAVDRVEARLGEGTVSEGVVSVQTTIDALLQRVAEHAVKAGLAGLARRHPSAAQAQVALVALDPKNGDILAMVGGRDYGTSGFNRAMKGVRQVGSTVKSLSWLALFESDVTMTSRTMVGDEPIEVLVNGEVWAPQNYDGEFHGELSLGQALATSRNIPAVMVSQWVGLGSLSEHLRELGLDRAGAYPAVALGAFEASPVAMAAAYTVFPGLGRVVRPRLVRSVRRPDGTEGFAGTVQKSRIVSDRAAFLVGRILETTMTHGTGKGALTHGVTGGVGGKTGTTDGGRDAWFVGYTPSLVVAVWVGFDKGRDLGLTGAQAALPIWARFVAGSGRMSPTGVVPPESVVAVSLCVGTGAVAAPACPETVDDWLGLDAANAEVCVLHDKGVFAGTRSIIQRIKDKLRFKDR